MTNGSGTPLAFRCVDQTAGTDNIFMPPPYGCEAMANLTAVPKIVGVASIPTYSGAITPGDCTKWSSATVITDAGAPCGSGGGGSAFSAITNGTNTTANMVVGSGAILQPSGSGTVTANAISGNINLNTPTGVVLTNGTGLPFSALVNGTNTAATMLVGTGGSLSPVGSGVISATTLATTPSQCTGGQFATGVTAVGNANCAGGVTSFSGDGTLISNSSSVGAVTATLGATGVGYGVWGNIGASSGAPAYHAMSTYPTAAFPTLNQNTTGTAANLSGTPALPNGTTATTQTLGDNTTHVATDAFVIANAASAGVSSVAAGGGIAVSGTGGGPYTGAVTVSAIAANRTVTTSPTVLSTDMAGQINSNVTGGGTLTIPAISSTVFPAGATLTVVNYSASTEAVTTTPTVNAGGGCVTGTGIPSGDTWNITSNGTTLDCNQTVSAGGGASGANPTGTVGLSTVNGVATTFLRSDGAPPLSQGIVPTWTGVHTFSATPVFNAGETVNGTDNINVSNNAATNIGTGTTTSAVTFCNIANICTFDGPVSFAQGTTYSGAAWTTAGIGLSIGAATFNDNSSSGTVATQGVYAIAQPTLKATTATTYTSSATLYIAGPPIASTNVTQSVPFGFFGQRRHQFE